MLQAVPSQSLLQWAGANTKWSWTTLLQSAFLIQIKAASKSLLSTPVIPFSVPQLCAQGVPPLQQLPPARRGQILVCLLFHFFLTKGKRKYQKI